MDVLGELIPNSALIHHCHWQPQKFSERGLGFSGVLTHIAAVGNLLVYLESE